MRSRGVVGPKAPIAVNLRRFHACYRIGKLMGQLHDFILIGIDGDRFAYRRDAMKTRIERVKKIGSRDDFEITSRLQQRRHDAIYRRF